MTAVVDFGPGWLADADGKGEDCDSALVVHQLGGTEGDSVGSIEVKFTNTIRAGSGAVGIELTEHDVLRLVRELRGLLQHVQGLDDLRMRVHEGRTNYAVLLAAGAYSRKGIRLSADGTWLVTNHIDGSHERLTDNQLMTGFLGEAIRRSALVER